MPLGHRGEQPLGVGRVVVVHEAGADARRAGRGRGSARAPRRSSCRPRPRSRARRAPARPRSACGPATLNISVGARSARARRRASRRRSRASPSSARCEQRAPRARAPRPRSPARACTRPRRATPASDSNGSVPSSQRSGDSSGDGRSLSGRSSLEQLRAAPHRIADVRAEPLVGRAARARRQPSAARSMRPVRRGVHGVDVDARADARGRRRRCPARSGHGADRVGGGGDRDPARARRRAPPRPRSRAARASPARARRSARSRPRARRAITHGRTLASWSRRVQTISSPGCERRARRRPAKRIVSAVI